MAKFDVTWNGRCFLCNNPLDIKIVVNPDKLYRISKDFTMFHSYHPKDLVGNFRMFKVRGGKAYKCCLDCFDRPWPVPNLRDREVGVRSRRVVSNSVSEFELYMWFKALHTYIMMDPVGKFKELGPSKLSSSGLIISVTDSF